MPDVLPLIDAESIALELLELDDNAPARATVHRGTLDAVTDAGTFGSPIFTGTNSWDYLGDLIEFISGTHAGMVREIVAFNGATVVVVHPDLPSDPAVGDAFRLWRRPAAVARAEGGGAGSVNADADAGAGGEYARDEAAEFWSDNATAGTVGGDRYALYRRSDGGDDGRVALITNDAAVGAGVKTFTVQGGASSPITGAAGHLYYVAKRLQHIGGALAIPSFEDARVERAFAKGASGNMEQDPHVLAPPRRGADLTLELELQPLQTAPSGTSLARGPAEAGDLLRSIFALDADGTAALAANGSQVGAAGTTPAHSTALVAPASGERFDVGNIVMVEGEAAQVRAIVDGGVGNDTLRLFPQLSTAALADATATALSGGWNLIPITTGFRSQTYNLFIGGRRWELCGWLPSLQITGMMNTGHGKLVFAGPAAAQWQDGYTFPTLISSQGGNRWPRPLTGAGAVQTFVPIIGGRSRVVIRDTRLVANAWTDISDQVIEVTLDVGYQFGRRASVGGFGGYSGTGISGRRVTVGSLKVHAESLVWRDRMESEAEFELFVQLGSARGETFVMALPRIQIRSAEVSPADGAYQMDVGFQVNRTGLDMTDDTSGATVTTRLSDVTLALL